MPHPEAWPDSLGATCAALGRVIGDTWGRLNESRLFAEPHDFKPDRRIGWERQDHRLVPHGARPVETRHHCPGEKVTLALMEAAMQPRLERARAGLCKWLTPIPTRPESGVCLHGIRRRPAQVPGDQ